MGRVALERKQVPSAVRDLGYKVSFEARKLCASGYSTVSHQHKRVAKGDCACDSAGKERQHAHMRTRPHSSLAWSAGRPCRVSCGRRVLLKGAAMLHSDCLVAMPALLNQEPSSC